MMTPGTLSSRSGLSLEQIEAAMGGRRMEAAALTSLADALGVGERDLLAVLTNTHDGIRVQAARSADEWDLPGQTRPGYRVRALAGDRLHPHTTSLEVTPPGRAGETPPWLVTYQHQYLYVLGDSPLRLVWRYEGAEQQVPS